MLSPLRGFRDLQSEMDRLFGEAFGQLPRTTNAAEWTPAIDVATQDGNVVIRAELPGIKPEDVDITLQENVLTISGERKAEQEEERGGYHIRERRYGSFSRSFTLPQGTDESKIKARYEQGVLELTVEGAATVQEPKRIQIEGSGN